MKQGNKFLSFTGAFFLGILLAACSFNVSQKQLPQAGTDCDPSSFKPELRSSLWRIRGIFVIHTDRLSGQGKFNATLGHGEAWLEGSGPLGMGKFKLMLHSDKIWFRLVGHPWQRLEEADEIARLGTVGTIPWSDWIRLLLLAEPPRSETSWKSCGSHHWCTDNQELWSESPGRYSRWQFTSPDRKVTATLQWKYRGSNTLPAGGSFVLEQEKFYLSWKSVGVHRLMLDRDSELQPPFQPPVALRDMGETP